MRQWGLSFLAGAAALQGLPSLGPAAACLVPAAAAFALRRRAPCLSATCAGFALSLVTAAGWLGSSWPCARDREAAVVEGRIAAPPVPREGRVDFDLDVARVDAEAPWPQRVRVAWYEPAALPAVGEQWRFTLRLRCRRGFANFRAPDRELALLRDRVDATAYVAGKSTPECIAPAAAKPVERLRARIAGAIAAALPSGASSAVLQGLAVGLRGNVPDRLWEAFSATGIAHLMAISGLHVTGCAVFVLAGLRRLARLPGVARLPGRLTAECLSVAAVSGGYAFLAGGSLPALRTLAMVAVFSVLRILRRCWPLDRVLVVCAVVLVATDPLALTSIGFWLSFGATAALMAAVLDGNGLKQRLAGFARSQLAVTAMLAPVLIAGFGRLSLVSPLVNAVAIPLFSVLLLPALLAATILAACSPALSAGLWRMLARILDNTWPWLEWIASWPAASWAPAAQPPVLVAVAAMAVAAALLVPLAGLRIAAGVLVSALCLGRASPVETGAFDLAALDVGQGLAVVVQTRHRVLVFDTGPGWHGGGAAAQVTLLPYLRARGIRSIDRLVLSHADNDHAGGAERLRAAMPVRSTMSAPGDAAGGEACRRGDAWQWDGVAFRVLHPPAGFAGDDNDRSCALLVAGRAGSALLLADPESAGEAELLTQDIAADLVLLPHHGSRSSSQAALVAAAAARHGIASAGYGNRWGMPDRAVVARWRSAGTSVLATAQEGAVLAHFPPRPGAVAITTARRSHRRWWQPDAGG